MTSDELIELLLFDPRVHQAEGFLSAQMNVSIDEAALMLRVGAQARGIAVRALADEVLEPLQRADINLAGTC